MEESEDVLGYVEYSSKRGRHLIPAYSPSSQAVKRNIGVRQKQDTDGKNFLEIRIQPIFAVRKKL